MNTRKCGRLEQSIAVQRELAVTMWIAFGMVVGYYYLQDHKLLYLSLMLHPHTLDTSLMWGVFAHNFLHANTLHLFGNLMMFIPLSVLITVTKVKSYWIMLALFVTTSIMLWAFADPDKRFVGASAVICAEAGFLFVSVFIERAWWSLFTSVTVTGMYGFMIYNGILHAPEGVSARSHLIGLLSGILVAFLLYRIRRWKKNKKREREME